LYIEVNTDLYKRKAIVFGVIIVLFIDENCCSIMNGSARIGESGARPHCDGGKTKPVDSKMLTCILCIHLMECYILNSIGRLARSTWYVYVRSVISDALDLW
jgi:hypothetical protein